MCSSLAFYPSDGKISLGNKEKCDPKDEMLQMLGSRRATRKEAQINAERCPNGHQSILESEDPGGVG